MTDAYEFAIFNVVGFRRCVSTVLVFSESVTTNDKSPLYYTRQTAIKLLILAADQNGSDERGGNVV